MKNLLEEKNLSKPWNLRFTEDLDIDIEKLMSPQALTILELLFDEYPKSKNKFFAFVNNIKQGNIIFNFIINGLLEQKLINRCIRIGSFNYIDYELPSTNLDFILFDNLEFSIFSDSQKHSFIQFVDTLYNLSNVVIFNIPMEKDLMAIPNSIRQLIGDTAIKILDTK